MNQRKLLRLFKRLRKSRQTLEDRRRRRSIAASRLFDAEWYLEAYPDARGSGLDPLAHFLQAPAAEQRDPSAWFSTRRYLEAHPGIVPPGEIPLHHYLRRGRWDGLAIFPADATLSPFANALSEAGMPWARRAADAVRPADAAYAEQYRRHLLAAHRDRRGPQHVADAALDFDPAAAPVKLIALYLPQFHPIPENDAWWGRGFTEWTNVVKAVPQFLGHEQPNLPADLGFYDLRLPEIQRQQIALAARYGIGGFCYYYYWFNGRKLLDRPLQNVLDDPTLDFPFCLCVANENWTRRWDGRDQEILIAQAHSPEDDLALIEALAPALADPRYIRVEGRPVLAVYRPRQLPDAAATAERWRRYCRAKGLGDPYLLAVRSFDTADPRGFGFDAAIQFPPLQIAARNITDEVALLNPAFRGAVYHYPSLRSSACEQFPTIGHPCHLTVMPSWDNEPRRPGGGVVYANSTPAEYSEWMSEAVRLTCGAFPPARRLVFINAWNEWAEGAYLEPDQRRGHAYLRATAEALRAYAPIPDSPADAAALPADVKIRAPLPATAHRVAAVAHVYYPELWPELAAHLANIPEAFDLVVTVSDALGAGTAAAIRQAFPQAAIVETANRGRDIRPFLIAMRMLAGRGYRAVCKVHTKMSRHRSSGADWRRRMFADLLGSRESIAAILRAFDAQPRLGLSGPAENLLALVDHFGAPNNGVWLQRLREAALLPPLPRDTAFIAGSMFWLRPEALRPALDACAWPGAFETEIGQTDGTLAHAWERFFCVAVRGAGFGISETRAPERLLALPVANRHAASFGLPVGPPTEMAKALFLPAG